MAVDSDVPKADEPGRDENRAAPPPVPPEGLDQDVLSAGSDNASPAASDGSAERDAAGHSNGVAPQTIASGDGTAKTIAVAPDPATRDNSRPERVATFLVEGGVFDDWFLANRIQARFYVLNLAKVLADLNPSYTRMEAVFRSAERAIAEETGWSKQYRFAYTSSHTQLKPEKRFLPKLFGHAATIIVAMELIAKEIDPDYNVYDQLRIVPATFFIDGFNRRKLAELTAHFETLKQPDRDALFGADAGSDLNQILLHAIGQGTSQRLLEMMTSGYTATKWVCDELKTFVEDKFPKALHLGPVLQDGDPRKTATEENAIVLGNKGVAKSLAVPKTLPAANLPPCF